MEMKTTTKYTENYVYLFVKELLKLYFKYLQAIQTIQYVYTCEKKNYIEILPGIKYHKNGYFRKTFDGKKI